MLTRLIKTQLVLLTAVAVAAVVVLAWYYLQIPRLVGIGRYTVYAELPQSGGCTGQPTSRTAASP